MSIASEPAASTGGLDSLAGGLDRRTFIGLALGLLSMPFAAPAAGSALTTASSAGPDGDIGIGAVGALRPAISPNALLSTLSDPAAAGWLGQRYLAEHPQERDVNRLVDQLVVALNAQQSPVPTDKIALQQALSALIQHEYIRTATLLSVDGWLLAPSEARLYALAALLGTHQRSHAPAPLHARRPTSRPTERG